ncbi:GDP-mannose 4,6-dehydratase [Candidatus Woesearchaeota archaeon]|nr:GDP-mannose 4,6-dehydratase [Candidatus Woesearchaeota archaeon]
MKTALITGITGQDGSYLAELLLEKGYKVYGMHRRSSVDGYFHRVKHIMDNPNFELVCADLTDGYSIEKVIKEVVPDEVYNLAAQSHVRISFDQPFFTREVNHFGLLRISQKLFEINKNAKLYQASTSELFGAASEVPQNEKTPFNPVSPYAKAKLEAHEHIAMLREKGYFACAGILFNHESERRGLNFVTRKITSSAVRIKLGKQEKLGLGNLYAKRDWGHSKDYVKAMHLMMQQDKPEDFVIGTGETRTIKDFVNEVFNCIGMPITWEGEGLDEKGYSDGKEIISINPKFFRPNEVNILLADPSKAKEELGWIPEISFKMMVEMMIKSDMKRET